MPSLLFTMISNSNCRSVKVLGKYRPDSSSRRVRVVLRMSSGTSDEEEEMMPTTQQPRLYLIFDDWERGYRFRKVGLPSRAAPALVQALPGEAPPACHLPSSAFRHGEGCAITSLPMDPRSLDCIPMTKATTALTMVVPASTSMHRASPSSPSTQ
jgi:hypothetical protein